MKTQYFTATTIDGFIADTDNSLQWLFDVPTDGLKGFGEFFAQVGAFAMGATTYEWVFAHENLADHPEKWSAWYGDTPCWVFTHRKLPTPAGVAIRFVEGDVAPAHAAMREAAGEKNIWLLGGGELVGCFADQGLLDELILSIAPVALGAGAPLLTRRITASRLSLTTVVHDEQFVHLTYRVGPAANV